MCLISEPENICDLISNREKLGTRIVGVDNVVGDVGSFPTDGSYLAV